MAGTCHSSAHLTQQSNQLYRGKTAAFSSASCNLYFSEAFDRRERCTVATKTGNPLNFFRHVPFEPHLTTETFRNRTFNKKHTRTYSYASISLKVDDIPHQFYNNGKAREGEQQTEQGHWGILRGLFATGSAVNVKHKCLPANP